jgi:CheY-like chemotaxis protein
MNPTRPRRILVIDDDAAIRELWADFLGVLGYEVVTAVDGTDGLARLDATCDLVLSDVHMPGLSGWDVVDALRRQGHGTPVILVTGSRTLDDVHRAQSAGVTLLNKPVGLRELRAAIQRALERGPAPANGTSRQEA